MVTPITAIIEPIISLVVIGSLKNTLANGIISTGVRELSVDAMPVVVY